MTLPDIYCRVNRARGMEVRTLPHGATDGATYKRASGRSYRNLLFASTMILVSHRDTS